MPTQLTLLKYCQPNTNRSSSFRAAPYSGPRQCPYCFKSFSPQGYPGHVRWHKERGDRTRKKPRLGRVRVRTDLMSASQLTEYRGASLAATRGDGVQSVVVPLLASTLPGRGQGSDGGNGVECPRTAAGDEAAIAPTREFVVTTPGVGAIKFSLHAATDTPENVIVSPELANQRVVSSGTFTREIAITSPGVVGINLNLHVQTNTVTVLYVHPKSIGERFGILSGDVVLELLQPRCLEGYLCGNLKMQPGLYFKNFTWRNWSFASMF